MGEPRTGPCADWFEADDLFECRPCSTVAEADQNAALAATVVEVASELLFMLSRRQFAGECSATVRPCRQSSCWGAPHDWYSTWNSSWGGCGCGADGWRSCACGTIDELSLGGYPLTAITEIKIDGVILDASKYRIDDFRFLVRTDGESWPSCQDLALADTEVDTFSVEFTYGIAPPASGVLAAKRLACELYTACEDPKACNLPRRVQTVTRQDVTVALLDPFQFFTEGRTGLYEVDLFLSAYMTGRQKRGGSIASPDVAPAVRHVNT